MDNTREKLIELLGEKQYYGMTMQEGEMQAVSNKEIAKHLIANGVTLAKETNVLTNADRIRAMSDEELAKWLLEVMKHKVACFGEGAFKYTPCRNVEHDCVKCGVEWLKQPVGDDDG